METGKRKTGKKENEGRADHNLNPAPNP